LEEILRHVKQNGKQLVVALTGLTAEFCWAAAIFDPGHKINVAAIDPVAQGTF
jgi:hypothetical protein